MLETIKYLIINYGYIAIFLGAFFESESIVLILGGLAARLGYLELPWLMAISYCGVFGGDQFYFFLGRWRGKKILSRYPRWEKAVSELQKILGSERALKILVLRFLLGLRVLAPLIVGLTSVSFLKFSLVDSLLLIPWTVGLCYVGYFLGKVVLEMLANLANFQLIIIGIIIGMALFVWGWVYFYAWLKLARRTNVDGTPARRYPHSPKN